MALCRQLIETNPAAVNAQNGHRVREAEEARVAAAAEERRRREAAAEEERRARQLLILHEAVSAGVLGDVRDILIGKQANWKLLTLRSRPGGQMPLHVAASKGYTDIARVLLDTKPDLLNMLTESKRTPLHEAAFKGHAGVVELLLGREGVLVDPKNEKGQTPAHLAAEEGHLGVLLMLVKKDADVELPNAPTGGKSAWEIMQDQHSARTDKIIAEIEDAIAQRSFDGEIKKKMAAWDSLHRAPIRGSSIAATGRLAEPLEKIRLSGINHGDVKKVDDAFDILSDRFFDKRENQQAHGVLFLALGLVTLDELTSEDVEEELNKYEAATVTDAVHPLFLLAHARLAEKKHDKLLQFALLVKFVSFSANLEWLSVAEKKLLVELKAAPVERNAKISELDRRYEKLKAMLAKDGMNKSDITFHLEPLEDLRKMKGLGEAKAEALSLYENARIEKLLKTNNKPTVSCRKTLNYLLMGKIGLSNPSPNPLTTGNPGTGKTETAKILAKILHRTGVRNAYRFVSMNASEGIVCDPSCFLSNIYLVQQFARVQFSLRQIWRCSRVAARMSGQRSNREMFCAAACLLR